MAFNQQEQIRNMAQDAYDILFVDGRNDFNQSLYYGSGLDAVIYSGAQATPNDEYVYGLTYAEIEAARISLQALSDALSANSNLHRNALAKIVKARNG